MLKFLSKVFIVILFISCSDPSEEMISSTIEIMGEKYGPGYYTENGNTGRSNWSFTNGGLNLNYSVLNRFTASQYDYSLNREFTNYRRYVSFDEDSKIPPTWQVYADWGSNADYWITLRHFSRNEFNDYYDDYKRSSKDQWALIHDISWDGGAWAEYQTYLTNETAEKLLSIFKVDTESDEYKEAFKKYQKEKEEKEVKRIKDRKESFNDFYINDLINGISILSKDNYLYIDDFESIKFLLKEENLTPIEFYKKMSLIAENDFKKIGFQDYIKIFDYYNEFRSVDNRGTKNQSLKELFETVIQQSRNESIQYLRSGHLLFFKENDSESLNFKLLTPNYDYSKDIYNWIDIDEKRLRSFYTTFSGLPMYYGTNGEELPCGDSSVGRCEIQFYIYKSFYNFLIENIQDIKIEGIDLNQKVLVFPVFDHLGINTENSEHNIIVQEWLDKNNN